MSGDIRLEIVVGAGSPPAITLREGEPREPFTAGFEGTWSLGGAGVARVHAHFHFDGETLYVASADARNPALLEGEPVAAAWTPVPVPSNLALGSVVVSATLLGPPDSFSDKTEPRAHAPSERTRYAPVDQPSVVVAPAPKLPTAGGLSPSAPPPTGEPRPPRPADRASATAAGLAFWRAASLPKKMTYVLLPFALVAAAYVVQGDDAPERAARPKPAPSASAVASAPLQIAEPLPPARTSASADDPPRSASAARGKPMKRTAERDAVDRIAAGAYGDAAKLLDEMAVAGDKPEYREAARVLRAKAKEGSP